MKGQLFTQFLLSDGIRTTAEWGAAASKLADFRRDVGNVHQRFEALQQPNEAVTAQDLIRPVMEPPDASVSHRRRFVLNISTPRS